MTITGEIQNAAFNSYSSKKTGATVSNVRVVFMDKSKLFRCMTPMQIDLTVDQFNAMYPKKKPEDLADEKCTVCITEMTARNAFIGVRGQFAPGHVAAEAVAAAQAPKPAAAA